MSLEEPAATIGWPEGRPLYWMNYYPDAREVFATVSDLHGTHLFTMIRSRRDEADDATGPPHGADPLIQSEVVRLLRQEDWETNAVYRLD
jgi:hypothetical protein